MNTNNTSNPPFRIGQKVVRVGKSIPPFVVKGEFYIVANLKRCPSCGNWKIACVEFPPALSGRKEYCNCGNTIISDGFHYGRAEGFAPIEENKERIRYVAVSETLREKAEEVVVESCNLS